MGVFQIRNMVNNKIYIGSSLDLKAIWNSQKFQLDFGIHSNSELQKDWKEFGPGNFEYEILEELEPNEDKPLDYNKELKALEEMIVEERQPFEDRGYNSKAHYKGMMKP
jgi:hypothetical protein